LSTESSLSQTTLSEPISDDELDKEIGLEESISESTVITNDQLDKEVVTHHPSTKMPEFTKSTKRSEEWKEMKPTTETEVKITTTQSSQLKNKMAPVFLGKTICNTKTTNFRLF
jgi:cytochrome c biogenesis protein ResB